MADISVTATSVKAGGNTQIEHGFAGETLTAGQVVYKDASSGGQFKKADCDSATVAAKFAHGIALNGGASGQPIAVATGGPVTFNAALTAGTAYYLSGTAGGIAPRADITTGDDVVFLGIATSTTVLDLRIVNTGVTLA